MKIILSCDDNPLYRDFWPIVSWAYGKMGFETHLAYVTKKETHDLPGNVTIFKPVPDVPEGNQGKFARFYLASTLEDICYIDDIDLFPLRKDFITDKVYKWQDFTVEQIFNDILLCVGAEVYGYTGTYPISQMTAYSETWAKFINPNGLTFAEVVRSLKDKAWFDDRENINIWPEHSAKREDYYFSDERLIKRLIYENPVPKLEIKRGYDNYLEATIDRATYNKDANSWVYDREKLKRGGYVNAHCVRPFNQELMQPLIDYINDNY